MTIGIDIDGTATKYPEFFVALGRAWRAAGHRVLLITGLGRDGVEMRRERWPILNDPSWFDEIITTQEYNASERALIGVEQDNEQIVGRFKQRVCRERGVAVMFDDQARVHRKYGDVPVFEVA